MRSMRQIRPRWSAAAGPAAAALLLAAAQGTAVASAAASGPAHGMHRWSGNLIADGNASAGYCTRDWNAATTIPGWTIRTGSPNVICYTAGHVPAPGWRGRPAFFSAGPYGDSAMTQTARLDPSARRTGPLVLPAVGLAGRVEGRARLRPGVTHFPRPFRPPGRRRRSRLRTVRRPTGMAGPGCSAVRRPGRCRPDTASIQVGVAFPGQFHPARRRARTVRPGRRPARQPLAHGVRPAARGPAGAAAVLRPAFQPRLHDHDGEHQRPRGAVRPQPHAVLPPPDGPGSHAGQLPRGLPPERRELPGHRGRRHLRQGRHLLAGHQRPAPEPR